MHLLGRLFSLMTVNIFLNELFRHTNLVQSLIAVQNIRGRHNIGGNND